MLLFLFLCYFLQCHFAKIAETTELLRNPSKIRGAKKRGSTNEMASIQQEKPTLYAIEILSAAWEFCDLYEVARTLSEL